MRHGVLLLCLALLAGCGDDDPRPADITEMRVVKVSGDQSAKVPPPEIAGALRITATVGEDGWTDEPLIARIVTTGGGGAQATITGLSADVVPAGTLVHWHLPEECGRLFAQTTATDDSAYTVNRWAPGTKAMTCEAQAGRLVGTEIVMDATWTLEILPGPMARLDLGGESHDYKRPIDPDTISIDIRPHIAYSADAYGNEISVDSLRSLPDSLVGWAWYDHPNIPEMPDGSGWIATLPPMESYSESCAATGVVNPDGSETKYVEVCFKHPRMAVWIDGFKASGGIYVSIFSRCTVYDPTKVEHNYCERYYGAPSTPARGISSGATTPSRSRRKMHPLQR